MRLCDLTDHPDPQQIFPSTRGTLFHSYIRDLGIPFGVASIGIISDYLTTSIGLQCGFSEANPAYHPLWAVLVFFSLIALLTLFSRRQRHTKWTVIGFASLSYIGAINNTLVLLGLFPGFLS
jgi:hypothetical protein